MTVYSIAEFVKSLDEALLSMDEEKIRAHQRKFNGREMPENKEMFWVTVHKIVTGRSGLPREFRQKSKDFLKAGGWQSYDDGDLT